MSTVMRTLVLAASVTSLIFAADSPAETQPINIHQTVTISYYGGPDNHSFSITPKDCTVYDGGSCTYVTDDPGTLILELDNGDVYASSEGVIRLEADQLKGNSLVRCSILTPDGQLIGWHKEHRAEYGGGLPSGGSGNIRMYGGGTPRGGSTLSRPLPMGDPGQIGGLFWFLQLMESFHFFVF